MFIGGILHDIHPHLTCTSTRMCQEREKNVRDSGFGFKPGFSRTQHPISVPVVAPGPEPSTSGPTSPSVRACLLVGSTRPPLLVTRCDFFVRMLVVWPLERPYACLSLHPLCTFTRRHTSVSDSRVGFLRRCPPCSSMLCSA